MKETPKETCIRLTKEFLPIVRGSDLYETYLEKARQCALITVREIINNFGLLSNGANFYCAYNAIEHYQECEKLLTKD